MLPTMFLSMWISNTATTAMMVKIVKAVLDELEKDQDLMDETLQTSEGKSSDSKDNIYSIEYITHSSIYPKKNFILMDCWFLELES